MEKTYDDLGAESKALLYVLGCLRDLHEKGLVEFRGGGCHDITDEGMAVFHELKASNYHPTPEEINYAVAMFRADDGVE